MSDSTSSGRRLRVSPSLVISIFALVIAMSSGAYAAVTIAAKNSVISSSIKNHNVKTADLNGAVKELAGEEYTCKDLRTWNATVLAAVALAAGAAEKGVPGSERARKRIVTSAVKQVSEHLGNTPTVARSSYVDPRVLERFAEGHTVLPALQKLEGCEAGLPADDATRAVLEHAVVELLKG